MGFGCYKPGILSLLGPVLDDVFAGIIADACPKYLKNEIIKMIIRKMMMKNTRKQCKKMIMTPTTPLVNLGSSGELQVPYPSQQSYP